MVHWRPCEFQLVFADKLLHSTHFSSLITCHFATDSQPVCLNPKPHWDSCKVLGHRYNYCSMSCPVVSTLTRWRVCLSFFLVFVKYRRFTYYDIWISWRYCLPCVLIIVKSINIYLHTKIYKYTYSIYTFYWEQYTECPKNFYIFYVLTTHISSNGVVVFCI
jgi:hypothetical protein